MRSLTVFAFAAAALLAACGSKESAPAGASGQPARPATPDNAVSGMVIADAPSALAPGATLTVRMLDVTRADGDAMLVAEQTYPVAAIPAEFTLPYDPAKVSSIRTFALEATVMDQGVARYVSQGRVGVLTQGKPSHATIRLAEAMVAPAPKDPVEEFNKTFAAFEAQLGALKRVTGSRIEGESAAYAWDAFGDTTGVRVVRETVNNAEGVTVSTSRYAFDEAGKPWLIERETGGAKTRLGWDASGTVLVHERNGSQADIDQGEIDRLVRSAESAKAAAAAKL
ncbi:MAG TPA: YbaY family lipoprotein [Candidatus Saccharimonadia bacterium]|nr:YbaY family lipoprotein [Candidatus Saccharimonadia bacterium]